jgi:hypothetical protein
MSAMGVVRTILTERAQAAAASPPGLTIQRHAEPVDGISTNWLEPVTNEQYRQDATSGTATGG